MTNDRRQLVEPAELQPACDRVCRALGQLDKVLLGRTDLHRLVLVGVLSRGHILFEGLPGTGKTALVKALGEILDLQFSRVQFTPDLLPGDILGAHILQESGDGREMIFHEGPVFTNILLADEINRASPKTQSALLEAMQERSVTLLGVTRRLPDPFFVMASQNPIELEGTYPLPEAQLDRFLFRLVIGDLDVETIDQIISSRRRGEPPAPDWRMSRSDLDDVYRIMEQIYLPRAVSRYVARLVAATHPTGGGAPEIVRAYVTYGASPRAAIAIAESARALALLSGRPTVGFEDVKAVAKHVLNHRIILNYKARLDHVEPFKIVTQLEQVLDETEMELPGSMSVQRDLRADGPVV